MTARTGLPDLGSKELLELAPVDFLHEIILLEEGLELVIRVFS